MQNTGHHSSYRKGFQLTLLIYNKNILNLMKFLLNRKDFLNEAKPYISITDKKNQNVKNILNLMHHLYDYFKSIDNNYVTAQDLKLKDLKKKYNINYLPIDGVLDLFLIKKGSGRNSTYALKNIKQKPTLKLAQKIHTTSTELRKNSDSERTLKIKKNIKYKNVTVSEKIKAVLNEIKTQIKKHNGNVVIGDIYKSFYLNGGDYSPHAIQLKIYYNYHLKTDESTLAQVEKYFGKSWKPKLGFPAFSEVKHRLYVWNAGDVTDEMVQSVLDSKNAYRRDLRKTDVNRIKAISQEYVNLKLKETPEEKERRRQKDLALKKILRSKETPEEKKKRRDARNEHMRMQRLKETPEEKEERRKKARDIHNKKKLL